MSLFTRKGRNRAKCVERENMDRLERAETDVLDLKTRAARATSILDERIRRNHWREAIEQMIQGA